MTSQRLSSPPMSAAGGWAIPPGPAAAPIPSNDGRFPCRAVSRFVPGSAPVGRSCQLSGLPFPQLVTLPGASVPGSLSSFPTIRQHNRPMARQDPSLFARSSASPAIPEFGVLVG